MASQDRSRIGHGSGLPVTGRGGNGARPVASRPLRLDQPARPPPRHLASSRRLPAPGLARSMLSAGLLVMLVLALGGTVVLRALSRPGVPGLQRGRPPVASRTTAASVVPSTTLRARAAVVQSLVPDGSFEAGLAVMRDRPGTSCTRVAGGAAGRWSMQIRALGGAPVPPGLWIDLARGAPPGTRYTAWAAVRGRPGLTAQIRLYERGPGGAIADRTLVVLHDLGWHQLGVKHAVAAPGSVLAVDVLIGGLAPGQTAQIDNVRAVRAP
ncbi:MAG TPA: hypothetical protein VEP73_07105 [Actinomycetota bacterium]|nr:hypothetical protein [Actinomycetota bacterium]